MILVRDIFHLKFGKARDGIAMWKEGQAMLKKAGHNPARLLTDVTGKYYRLILESTYPSLKEFEDRFQTVPGDEEWRKWYEKFTQICESGEREILRILD